MKVLCLLGTLEYKDDIIFSFPPLDHSPFKTLADQHLALYRRCDTLRRNGQFEAVDKLLEEYDKRLQHQQKRSDRTKFRT